MRPLLSPARLAVPLLLCASMVLPAAMAQPAASAQGEWSAVQAANGARTLDFKTMATLLGKTVPIHLNFFYSAQSSKEMQGAVGFDLEVSGVDSLAAFHFDDFEGPDASTIGKPLLTATVLRPGLAPLVYAASPSGSYARTNVFMFEVSAVTRKPQSPAKSILKALADDKAESLRITIVDSRDPKTVLEFSVPVADKRSAFKALLAP